MQRLIGLFLLGIALVALGAGRLAGAADQPPGPVAIFGSNAAGCIAGAVELPPEGPGFQEIRFAHSVFWGHPRTIALIELLAARAHAAGLPDLYVNDIAAPHGGPIPGHAGHEIGLETDIWLDVEPKPVLSREQREGIEVPSVVRPDGRAVDPEIWRPEHARLLQLAATLPNVDRIFVNPAIKRQLCEATVGDRSWLHVIRPWWGHAAHFHIRFRCPTDQPACRETTPLIPAGDGCDASLQWWFDQLEQPPRPPEPPHPPAPLPAACHAVLEGPAPSPAH